MEFVFSKDTNASTLLQDFLPMYVHTQAVRSSKVLYATCVMESRYHWTS